MIIFPVETTGFPASMLNVYPRVAAVFSHPHVEEWFVSRKQLVFFGSTKNPRSIRQSGSHAIQMMHQSMTNTTVKWCVWMVSETFVTYHWQWTYVLFWAMTGRPHRVLRGKTHSTWFFNGKMNYVEWWLNIHTLPIISNHVINESGKPASNFQLGIVISHPCLWDVHSSLAAVTRRRATGSPDDFMDFCHWK